MRQDGTYGTSLEVLDIFEGHGAEFYIHLENETTRVSTFSTNKEAWKISERPHKKAIHLLLSVRSEVEKNRKTQKAEIGNKMTHQTKITNRLHLHANNLFTETNKMKEHEIMKH